MFTINFKIIQLLFAFERLPNDSCVWRFCQLYLFSKIFNKVSVSILEKISHIKHLQWARKYRRWSLRHTNCVKKTDGWNSFYQFIYKINSFFVAIVGYSFYECANDKTTGRDNISCKTWNYYDKNIWNGS